MVHKPGKAQLSRCERRFSEDTEREQRVLQGRWYTAYWETADRFVVRGVRRWLLAFVLLILTTASFFGAAISLVFAYGSIVFRSDLAEALCTGVAAAFFLSVTTLSLLCVLFAALRRKVTLDFGNGHVLFEHLPRIRRHVCLDDVECIVLLTSVEKGTAACLLCFELTQVSNLRLVCVASCYGTADSYVEALLPLAKQLAWLLDAPLERDCQRFRPGRLLRQGHGLPITTE